MALQRTRRPRLRSGRSRFYVWRCVEGETEDEALRVALANVRSDPKLVLVAWEGDDPADLPRLKVVEVNEVETFGELRPPGSGYGFFSEP